MLRVVVASRLDAASFVQTSALARSLERIVAVGETRIDLRASNSLGLSEVYNSALDKAAPGDTLAFVHDDVHVEDWHQAARLEDALAQFDVVGVAGNRRRHPKQGSWPFTDLNRTWDHGWLSGAVAQGSKVSAYGPSPAPVVSLDGLFLAAKCSTLREAGIRFDPKFTFHFYDLDFCRSCEAAGLRMGTWPIALSHDSGGQIGTSDWYLAYYRYLAKWGD